VRARVVTPCARRDTAVVPAREFNSPRSRRKSGRYRAPAAERTAGLI